MIWAKGENFTSHSDIDSAVSVIFPEWGLGFRSVFDNREGNRSYALDRTFFFAQLAPEIGIGLDGGRHRVMGGVVWTQPIGCEWEGHRISPTLYYIYESSQRWRFAMGMLPRKLLLHDLPDFIMSDSARYFQPNLRSVIIGRSSENGFIQGILDWRGMQSHSRREAFCLIAQGEWHRSNGMWLAGGLAMLNHLAKQKDAPPTQHVIDNIICNPYVGIDLSRYLTPLSKMSLKVGALMSLTRDRGDSEWLKAVGLWSEFRVEWWRLSLLNNLYFSNRSLFPLYGRYGSMLNEGEPFYASRYYDRFALRGILLRWRDNIRLDASLDFNFTDKGMIFYQRIILKVDI